ncbi:MAG: AAA family ATPase [Deltaproteobacteria bacterium]|nr:AAA family ATPase [Deltaproteobacteria bacterium]
MFTEIGIENFKAFGKMQRIPLKPITLLYGPNSSGKSSLIQSLLLFKQTLEESGDEKIVLLPKGNLVDLGGYQEFINGHDTRKDFNLSLSYKYFWALQNWGAPLWAEGEKDDLSLEFSFSQDNKSEILLTSIKVRESLYADPLMEWKNVWKIPYLKRAVLNKRSEYEKDGDDQALLDKWLSDLKKSVLVLDHISMKHALVNRQWDEFTAEGIFLKPINLLKENEIEKRNELIRKRKDEENRKRNEELIKLQRYLEKESQEIKTKYDKLNAKDSGLNDEELQEKKTDLLVRQEKSRQLKKILELSKILHRSIMRASYEDVLKMRHFPVSDRLISLSNCFPDEKGNMTGTDAWLFQHIPEFAALGKPVTDTTEIYKLLNIAEFLPWTSSLLKEYLRRIVYIGPLREYPERVYSYSGNIPSNVGKSGKYTPDILMKRPDLVAKVNEWFTKFDIGYKLNVDFLKRNLFSLSLVEGKTGFDVSPKDVGFGIGQLLPILVQGVLSENKILIIEQPEIHVHPRLQAELGSFFSETAGRAAIKDPFDVDEEGFGNQFIIETHSEHLILRLLRLIRDTTNEELKEGEKPLRPEDVAVIYAKPTEHGTELMELRISEDGDFIDKWPDGFFTEREKELF